jgi:hypothetical protein
MKTSSLLALLLAVPLAAVAAERDTRVFEMRTYYAAPGKLDELHARFRNHTMRLFEKHGVTNLGYWVPLENADNLLIYVIAHPSREAGAAAIKAMGADPEWKQAFAESEAKGQLVAKAEKHFLTATDFSPAVMLGKGSAERVFELRTYTTTPGRLPALHARFRDHTIGLFARHGMTNLWYWQLLPDQKGAENTLVYLLAHPSAAAAKASFEAFRADPEWISARKASEEKAGGSLTVQGGVISLLLKPTDYSPIR